MLARDGKSCSFLFSKNGAKVVLADIDERGGQEVTRAINKESQAPGNSAIFVKTDVAKSNDAERCVKAAVAEFGKVDGLYNDAGINPVEL